MKYSKILIALIALTVVGSSFAQKAQKPMVKKKKPAHVVVEEPSRFDMMLENTQQIVFIDSVVVEKQQFLDSYIVSPEAGSLDTYNAFFKSKEQPYSTVYLNELGNKCWYALSGRLFTSDLLGNRWSEPQPLDGLGSFQRANYPFMLADGTTFYFAAISDEGLGGLDIYVSRYDSESGSFLLAENIGLPFNSEANDYMYVVDELNDIGYFATDRRQPEGMVCIYTFVPNQKRITLADAGLSKAELTSRARLERIADTWGDGELRRDAIERLESLTSQKNKQQQGSDFLFVINDDVTYRSMAEFQNPSNRERIKTLLQLKQQLDDTEKNLDQARKHFGTQANKRERERLKTEILVLEQDYYQLESDIRQLEKTIRNLEIQAL